MLLSEINECLLNVMSMTEVYQPVIVKELLLSNGECTKYLLATVIAGYEDEARKY